MIFLTQNQIVDLFHLKMKSLSTAHWTAGTYNAADPTHCETLTAEAYLEYGFSTASGKLAKMFGGIGAGPECEFVKVRMHDVTWGVEITFETSLGVEQGYWGRPFGEPTGAWGDCSKHFFTVFRQILLCGEDPKGHRCPECLSIQHLEWKDGHPGESLLWCVKCHEIVNTEVNVTAIQ